jgi:uncharacterized membrane protein (DUF2068 family)
MTTPEPPSAGPQKPRKPPLGVRLIAAEKLGRGLTLLCLSFGLLDLVHKNVTDVALHILRTFRISPENHLVGLALVKLGLVRPDTLMRLGVLSAVFSIILLVEGTALWVGASWAEYLVVISTGIFVPEEFHLTLEHFTWLRLSVLLINGSILIYMLLLIGKKRAEAAMQRQHPARP